MSRKAAVLVLVVVGLLSLSGRAQKSKDTRLLFTGDILLSRQVEAEIERRHASPWGDLTTLLRNADWVGGNFEGAIGSTAQCHTGNGPCFSTPESAITLLKAAGFRGVTVENNHSGDLGTTGRAQTRSSFADAGLLPLNFDHSPQFLRFGETTVALIAITVIPSADGRRQTIPSVEVDQKLRTARRLANLVVVSIHWGTELQDWTSDSQRKQAAWLVEHGADLVLGHHPHVVQAPECVQGKPVFFSLGNHVFDQKYPETKKGLIADCRISAGRLKCEAVRTLTRSSTAFPELAGTEQSAQTVLSSCTPALRDGLMIEGYSIRPEPWSAGQPLDGIVLDGWRNGKLEWRSRRQRVVSVDVGKLGGEDAPAMLFTLERHISRFDTEDGLRPYVYSVGRQGLIARWRGTALAWPLLDAVIAPDSHSLCALHRGDSFINLQPNTKETRVEIYRWNQFGFSGRDDVNSNAMCSSLFATH